MIGELHIFHKAASIVIASLPSPSQAWIIELIGSESNTCLCGIGRQVQADPFKE